MSPMTPRPKSMRHLLAQGLATCGRAVNDLVFPWACVVCGFEGAELRGPFCTSCRSELLETAAMAGKSVCPRCALPAGPHANLQGGCTRCRGRHLGFDEALALGPYEGTIRDLCLLLKHARNAWLAHWLSDLLAEARNPDLLRLPRDAWMVPVPLHWWRRLRRGYNQAEALAQGLSRRTDLRVHQSLWRIKAADHLAYKNADERMQAMRGAFQARRDHGLKGRTILLVDDILTTGATTGAAARALKQAGARRVVVAVLARTV
jgi:ComF family protein